MIDVPYISYDNHLMMHVGQIITLVHLNVHSAVCQLYLNKCGGKMQVNTDRHNKNKHCVVYSVVRGNF